MNLEKVIYNVHSHLNGKLFKVETKPSQLYYESESWDNYFEDISIIKSFYPNCKVNLVYENNYKINSYLVFI